jgi:hypothetical protein
MLSALSRRYARLVLLLAALAVALMSANAQARSAPRATTTDVTLTVTKNGTGSGTVSSNPTGIQCGSTCSYNFPVGTQVTLTATPAAGSSFQLWYSTGGSPCHGSTTCTFTMNQAESIRATFNVIQESVSVSNAPEPGASGTIVISGPGTQLTVGSGQQRQAFFNYGATVTISPTAASGSAFAGWSSDCSGFGTCVIVTTRSFDIQGTFAAAETLKVQRTGKGSGTVTSSPGGLDCPSTCSGTVAAGAAVTLTATPAPGSYFADWSFSEGCASSSSACTFEMPASGDVEVADFRLDHCLVPNVKRLGLANAKSRLFAYSCRAGTIARVYSKHVKKGAVISQKPKAGKRLARGAKVRLVLSRGQRH